MLKRPLTPSPLVLRRLGILFLILSATWLLAPALSHELRPGPNLISEYESATSRYGTWFRLGDTLAALLLIGSVATTASQITRRWGKYVPHILITLASLMIIDVLLPVDCRVTHGVCQVQPTVFSIVHGIESVTLGAIVAGLSVFLVWRKRYGYWFIGAQLAAFIAGLLAQRLGGDHWLFAIQAGYQLVQSYWLYSLVFVPPIRFTATAAGSERQPLANRSTGSRLVRNVMAVWVAVNGAFALLFSWHHITLGDFARPFVFTSSTPWLLGHTLLVGIILLYLARQLQLGDRRALILTVAVLFSALIHVSLNRHSWGLLLVYGLPLLALIYYRRAFDRNGGFLGFTSRLRFLAAGLIGLVLLASVVTVGFRFSQRADWNRSPYDIARVVKRVALLEVSTSRHDSMRLKVFDRLLTLLGAAAYLWLLTGLFLPRSSFQSGVDQPERDDMLRALTSGSNSSEDYFKLWPAAGKQYFRTDGGAIIAYAEVSGLVVALADPITRRHGMAARRRAAGEFLAYCRSQGFKSAWLVVSDANRPAYEAAGYRTMPIGSSARIAIEEFCSKTVRNKWWRWQMNRAKRAGYRYESFTAPHSPALLRQARSVSDAWLTRPGHREQSFAMGYFDEAYMNQCRLHCLYDAEGNLVAFANELPIYNNNPQTTVDLIRFLPDVDGAMPVLLAHSLQRLGEEARYKYFDLGLVPLANVDTRLAKLVKRFGANRFSAHGLAQFKNKFEPDWQPGHLAYDGDGIDLAKMLASLSKVLDPPTGA